MIPDSVIQDDAQHTMHYSQSLPYANLLDNEAKQWLHDICTNLALSVKAKDYTGTVLAWVKRLSSYLDMKHAIDKETRIALTKLLYEMVILPGMDPALVEFWANCCSRLIRSKKRLDATDLELPWRPLYNLIDKTLFPKARQRALVSESKLLGAVLRLVYHAQRFFSPTSTEEILKEMLPLFTPHHVSEAMKCQGYLVLFLPVEHQPNHTIKSQDYMSTLFSLWSMFTLSGSFDSQFSLLLSYIAEHNIQHDIFTHQQIKLMFTTTLRVLNLPLGTRNEGAGLSTTGYGQQCMRTEVKAGNSVVLRRKPEKVKSLARFIVYTITPDNNGKSFTLDLLQDLIQATELYFHPSNHGHWSYFLPDLVRHLSFQFLKRWREELEDDCKTPQHRRLTPELRKEFVLMLRPVTYLSMFGKDQYTVNASQSTLKSLSWLEPGLIFPGLLERIYPSLETLTETHRTSSALSILTDIALPLFTRDHYPAGGKHLLPLLHLSLPGIDMNDPVKTISSLMFVSSALMSIPIMDLTQVHNDYFPTEEDGDELSRETEDYLVKQTTGEFEEWIAKFMRRVFTIFENLPQENHKKQNNMEVGLTQMLLHTCDIIFNQLSEELYDLVLKLVVEFVNDRVLPNAVRGVGQLCDSLTAVHPKKASKVFIPICISNIQMELEHGAASTIAHAASSNTIPSDSTFHWYQHILYSVVSSLGPEVLSFKTELIDITHLLINQCKTRCGMNWTGRLIRGVLSTMLNLYPTEYKSLSPSAWNDKEYMKQHAHLVWGQPGDPANIEIQWHVPTEAEKEFAITYLTEFLNPSMQRLKELMKEDQVNNDSHAMSNEFCRHLFVVRNCLVGSATMVADDGVEENAEDRMVDDEDPEDVIKTPKLQVGYVFTDESDPRLHQARHIRKELGELIHDLSTYFKIQREDDVESIKVLIKIARTYLSDRGVEKTQFDHSKSGYSFAKNIGSTPLCKKRYPRNLLIRRAYNHHLLRLRQNVQGRVRTPLHDAILSDLLDMSLGSYAEIRKAGQVALTATSRLFRDSKSLIIPVLLDALKSYENPDRMKGALYLFFQKSILMACLRNWKFIPSFVMAVLGAQHQDKLTIQELIRKVFLSYVSHYNLFSFRVLSTDQVMDPLIQALSPETFGQTEFTQRAKVMNDHVNHRSQQHAASYEGILVQLLDFLMNPNVHWRYATMAANFIEVFIRSDAKPTKRLAEFANTASLSELPTMRRIGVSATTQLLLAIKQRTFAHGNEDLIITKDLRNPLKLDIQVDPKEHDKGKALLKASYQELSTESLLVDNMTVGWYVWPESYTAYKINTQDSLFSHDNVDTLCQEAYEEFSKTYHSTEYWEKLCSYMSQEVNQKQEDRFTSTNARLFCSIFQTFGDGPLISAKAHIEKLCQGSDQKNSQRAASEILGGLIRGMKHWSLAKFEQVWSWLTPLLRTVFSSITPDSLTYWETFVRFCTQRRDPRRIKPLMDIILEAELDPTSDAAFNESRKLLLVRAVITSLQWRFVPLMDPILCNYLNNVQHPYKQVREVLGVNLNELLQLEWIPSHDSVDDLLQVNNQTDGVGNVPITLSAKQSERIDTLLSKLDTWFIEMKNISDTTTHGASDYAHASKTISCWLHEATNHWGVSGTLPYVGPFLPKLFVMQEVKDDQDLQTMATRVLGLIARLNYPPSMVPMMVNQFTTILTTSSSWHMRSRALPVLQIFFFKHLFLMNSQELIHIMQVIGNMLMDTQIEVRQLASVTLGGLVRCSQRDAIQSLLTQFTVKMKVRVPKRKRDKVTGKNVEPVGFGEAVLHKHAGVLGISCLINAFPYEVPEWMPTILCELADCMSDPAAEIQATIRKTFSDFRRTHLDTWHEDMHKFTEDQLSLLSDMLISPSYYA